MPKKTTRDCIAAIQDIVRTLRATADRPQDATPETHNQFLELDVLTKEKKFRESPDFIRAVAMARRFFKSRRGQILEHRALQAFQEHYERTTVDGRARRERRIYEKAFATKHRIAPGPLRPINRTAARVISRRVR